MKMLEGTLMSVIKHCTLTSYFLPLVNNLRLLKIDMETALRSQNLFSKIRAIIHSTSSIVFKVFYYFSVLKITFIRIICTGNPL